MGCVNQKDGGSNIVCRAKHFHFEVRVLSVDALAARTRPKWPNSADKRSLGERTGRTRTSPTRLRSAVPGSHSHTLRRGTFVWLTADFLPLEAPVSTSMSTARLPLLAGLQIDFFVVGDVV